MKKTTVQLKLRSNYFLRLKKFRDEIDSIDKSIVDLLKKRMIVVGKIGRLKAKARVPVVNRERSAELFRHRIHYGLNKGIDGQFIKRIFSLIHRESVKCQKRERINQPEKIGSQSRSKRGQ